jgi:uncharacterized membrane protein
VIPRSGKREEIEARSFPVAAGILLGLGLGGFFDGIVLHQLLQWHHMVTSAGYPADTLENLELNTVLDGVFHAGTYLFVVLGVVILWRAAHRRHLFWSTRLPIGTLLMGFGLFNLAEGVVNHHLLGFTMFRCECGFRHWQDACIDENASSAGVTHLISFPCTMICEEAPRALEFASRRSTPHNNGEERAPSPPLAKDQC